MSFSNSLPTFISWGTGYESVYYGIWDTTHTQNPLQQKPGKKTGKPGEVWFNQAYQAFGLNSSLVKSLVCLVLPAFPG